MSNIEPNSPEDFDRRFTELCAEAKTYGISSIYGMNSPDPFSKEDTMHHGYDGGLCSAIGLAVTLLHYLKGMPGDMV